MSAVTAPLLLTLVLSAFGVCLSLATYVRAGRWRESDDGRELDRKLDEMEARVGGVEATCKAFDVRFAHVATTADIAGVQADIRGLDRSIRSAAAGVARIEGHLIERSK